MGKQLIFDPVTGEKKLVELPDEEQPFVILPPSDKERLDALEAAMLAFLDM